MKRTIFTFFAALCAGLAMGQSGQYGQGVLSGPAYSGPLTIGNGGSILVGSGGKWTFGGNITSADKGGANAPTATGRTEIITFDGSGGFTANGYTIDGYAATTAAQTASLALPIGNTTAAYPVTIPIGKAVTAAYFAGSGSSQNKTVTGNSSSTTEYSPFIDIPSGFAAGSYTFSYPGFASGINSSLLSSGNSSVNGTGSGTSYALLANVSSFSSSAATTTASLAAHTATQVYFSTSSGALPLTMVSFTAMANGCTASLNWKTVSEVNSSYYGLEYGTDGFTFVQVAAVASRNSATGATYAATYPLASGTNFFRLKAVDKDGTFTYGSVVNLSGTGACGTMQQLTVWPNPTNNMVNIHGLVLGSTVSLYGVNGQKLSSKISTATNQTIDLSLFTNGVYLLLVQAPNGTKSNIKLIKKQ